MPYLIAIDGGGTQTTLALADESGRERLRRSGPAGLVDPRHPEASAEMLARLTRDAVGAAGVSGAALALCAGLAGVGNHEERERVRRALADLDVAERVLVVTDGEAALHGAFRGGAGILLIAGTGSVAWGRGADGRVEYCGGWGLVLGDEGSGYAIARTGLRAALQAADGRGPATRLLPALLHAMGLSEPSQIPPWVGRATKAEIAALTRYVVEEAQGGDTVAGELLERATTDLALHAVALANRLSPWPGGIPVALHGGVARHPPFRERVEQVLLHTDPRFAPQAPEADAVQGALDFAQRLARS